MGAVLPVAIITIIVIPRHRAYVVLCHFIEVVVCGFDYGTGFRQSPALRTNRTSSFIAVVIHVSGSTNSGGSVGIIDTVGVIGGFRLVAGTDGFMAFRVSVPAGSALAGGGVGGASGSPVGANV